MRRVTEILRLLCVQPSTRRDAPPKKEEEEVRAAGPAPALHIKRGRGRPKTKVRLCLSLSRALSGLAKAPKSSCQLLGRTRRRLEAERGALKKRATNGVNLIRPSSGSRLNPSCLLGKDPPVRNSCAGNWARCRPSVGSWRTKGRGSDGRRTHSRPREERSDWAVHRTWLLLHIVFKLKRFA